MPDVEIVNFDAMTYGGNPANIRDVELDPRYRFVRGNICDATAIDAALCEPVDAIVNFAAETHVDRSIMDPEAFLRTDILGTHVLLEAARKHEVRRFLQVSTDEVYGHVAEGHPVEGDALAPRSPYSASKAGGDLQVLAYGATFGSPVLVTRGSKPGVGVTFADFDARQRAMRRRFAGPLALNRVRTIVQLEQSPERDPLQYVLADRELPPGRDVPLSSSLENNDINTNWVGLRLWTWSVPELANVMFDGIVTRSGPPLRLALQPGAAGTIHVLGVGGGFSLDGPAGTTSPVVAGA